MSALSTLVAAPIAALSAHPATASVVAAATDATTSADLTGIAKWAVDIMDWMGGLGVAFLIALENLFPPIPSEIILPLAGFTASRGTLGLAEAIIWATVGSAVGAVALYYLGYALGRERTRRLMGALPLVKTEDVIKTEAWFDKNGQWTVLIGRVIPVFRSLISIPAGVTRMPILKFLALTILGSAVWNTILVSAGFVLGENWEAVDPYVSVLTYVVVAVVLVAILWFVISRIRQSRKTELTKE